MTVCSHLAHELFYSCLLSFQPGHLDAGILELLLPLVVEVAVLGVFVELLR